MICANQLCKIIHVMNGDDCKTEDRVKVRVQIAVKTFFENESVGQNQGKGKVQSKCKVGGSEHDYDNEFIIF